MQSRHPTVGRFVMLFIAFQIIARFDEVNYFETICLAVENRLQWVNVPVVRAGQLVKVINKNLKMTVRISYRLNE